RVHCSGRLRLAFGGAAVHRAVSVWGDRRAVRADQIRHSSRPSRPLRTSRRQRAGGRRDFHRNPAGHHCRRHRRQGRRRPRALCPSFMVGCAPLAWGASLFIPRTGQGAPHLKVQKNVLVSTIGLLSFLREDPRLWWGALVTSWFWLVGAVSLSLMPPLVKNVLGGNEEVVTTCLAIFSISIAIGSGLAAWLAAGRIILLPTVIGAVLLGAFAIDLGASTLGASPIPGLNGYLAAFTSGRGIRLALDLAGFAIAGGLFIVPTFAAVQAWAGADRRARVVAAVNVLNAAFMAGSAVLVATLQTAGMTTAQLFLLLGAASLLVAIVVGRTMPASALSDVLSIIYRALFRMEVKGIDNLSKAGPNRIIALNHVSFL